jgi:hypothetical protein
MNDFEAVMARKICKWQGVIRGNASFLRMTGKMTVVSTDSRLVWNISRIAESTFPVRQSTQFQMAKHLTKIDQLSKIRDNSLLFKRQ